MALPSDRSCARGARRGRWLRRAATLGLVALATCQGPELARLEVGGLGKTAEKRLELKPGTRLEFGIASEKYEYSGAAQVVLDVVLLRDAAQVGTMSCNAYRSKGGSGCGSSLSAYNSGCAMTVPAGGANVIRASTRIRGGGRLSFEKLAVRVHRDE